MRNFGWIRGNKRTKRKHKVILPNIPDVDAESPEEEPVIESPSVYGTSLDIISRCFDTGSGVNIPDSSIDDPVSVVPSFKKVVSVPYVVIPGTLVDATKKVIEPVAIIQPLYGTFVYPVVCDPPVIPIPGQSSEGAPVEITIPSRAKPVDMPDIHGIGTRVEDTHKMPAPVSIVTPFIGVDIPPAVVSKEGSGIYVLPSIETGPAVPSVFKPMPELDITPPSIPIIGTLVIPAFCYIPEMYEVTSVDSVSGTEVHPALCQIPDVVFPIHSVLGTKVHPIHSALGTDVYPVYPHEFSYPIHSVLGTEVYPVYPYEPTYPVYSVLGTEVYPVYPSGTPVYPYEPTDPTYPTYPVYSVNPVIDIIIDTPYDVIYELSIGKTDGDDIRLGWKSDSSSNLPEPSNPVVGVVIPTPYDVTYELSMGETDGDGIRLGWKSDGSSN